MKKHLLSIAAVLILTGFGASAQTRNTEKRERKEKKEKAERMGEYEEIIIKKKDKDTKDTKVVIDIQGDQVLVNGTPIDKYVDDNVIVQLREPLRIHLSAENRFRNPGAITFSGEPAPFLGVTTEGSAEGARIVQVSEHSGAAAAGLKAGDLITKIDDREVFDHAQLSAAIGGKKPEDKVTVHYKREGKNRKTTATLGTRAQDIVMHHMEIPPIPPVPPMPPMGFQFDGGGSPFFNFPGSKPRLGLKVQDTEEGKGVKVLGVDDESAAQKAGIQHEDIILSFDGTAVNNTEELAKASRDAKDKSAIKVELQRDGSQQTVEIKIPKKLKTAEL